MNFSINADDQLSQIVREKGIDNWLDLLDFIKCLPYGRNKNRSDLSLVISEQKGSCSSKHALLKKVADQNGILNVKLILGIYKMNKSNTPLIGDALSEYALSYIPEAHCYLKINGERVDLTTNSSAFKKLEKDILVEQEIEPEQVADYKVSYHQAFMKKWLLEVDTSFGFDEMWRIREQCIENISANNKLS
ncbi:hypothetical protein [Aureibacter tunicatorum]|uniref:Uncharacterized protein n=1 Tax=Aureibacter tunicatorum TaxID=866807 RepID=A0AAE3XSS7_9BACT|nr:hypothetical protein [Aureibacter tunicatorum]MDR6241364.1 hypothetical protein [Aureibacter tunicatorum]BDD06791.1 hypothetical protein AUTU_42740 [Aureibacter tunicatorum]